MKNSKTKKCNKCGETKDKTLFYKNITMKDGLLNHCKECKNKYDKERVMTWGRTKRLKNQKDYKDRIRQQLQDAYGNMCECCGEDTPEFLELDHRFKDGAEHRKTFKIDIYKLARDEGYPYKYRLLCSNCNHSLGVRGYCPHNNL